MRRLFGTDGVRGIANVEPMTPETVVKLGRAVAHVCKKAFGRGKIVIGKDTRLTGYMLEGALLSGICSMGMDVLLVGPLPTPGIAFITRSLRADAGVVISASHNPFEDNGIKFFSGEGWKLPDEIEKRIEELIFTGEIESIRPQAREIGKAHRVVDAQGRYVEFVKSTFPKGLTLEGLKVVVDCANGAAYKVTPAALKELGAELVTLNVHPNGVNINKECGSLYPQLIQRVVQEEGADIGIAHDGDADRAIFADEKGQLVDGDQAMAICALELQKERRLKEDTLVTTVMSNMGLELAMKEAGIKVVKTAVGDRYVLERMLKHGYNFGGEQSGHIIFLDYNTTGDGLITALQVLAIMKKTGKLLSELASCMTPLPQVLMNVKVKKKREFSSLPEVAAAIERAERKLDGRGRVLVRYSGTEPLARVMVEGMDRGEITSLAQDIASSIEGELG